MDLELETIRTVGRTTVECATVFVREIEEPDLILLSLPRPSGQLPAIKRLKERHHKLARLIAGGMAYADAAFAVDLGYHQVARLMMDPSFQELVGFYKLEVDRQYAGMHEKLAALGEDAVDEIRARLEEDGEKVPLTQLVEITKMAADRTGFGPMSSSTNVNVYVGTADRLKAARLKAREAASGMKTIEASPREAAE